MKTKVLLFIAILILLTTIVSADGIVNISPANPYDNQDLICTISGARYQDDYTFEWRLNGHLINSNSVTTTQDGSYLSNTLSNSGDSVNCAAYDPFDNTLLGLDTVTVQQLPNNLNQPPIANAGHDFTTIVNTSNTFDGSRSTDSDGTIVNYHWDFGDGDTADDSTVIHTFTRTGTYYVNLTVIDNLGATSSASIQVLVVASSQNNQPPIANQGIANPGQDFSTTISTPTNFDGSSSTDSDGTIVNYHWDFGDGTTASGSTVTHTFTRTGTYYVSLTVTDNQGATDTQIVVVQVNSQTTIYSINNIFTYTNSRLAIPVDNFYRSQNVFLTFQLINQNTGTGINVPISEINAALNTQDGSTLQLIPYTGTIGRWGITYVQDGRECLGIPGFCLRTGSTYYYTTRIPITDSYLGTTQLIISTHGINRNTQIILLNNQPTANAGEDINTNVNDAVLFSSQGSIDVEDGMNLLYNWDFGDGTTADNPTVTHTYTQLGTYTVTLTVTDSEGTTNFDTSRVAVGISGPGIPVVSITTPIDGSTQNTGTQIQFNSIVSDTEDNLNQLECTWIFGDGTTEQGLCSEVQQTQYIYNSEGTYTITLRVKDTDNHITTDSLTINLVNPPIPSPITAVIDASNTNPSVNEELNFSAERSTGNIVDYLWNFGDGTTAVGKEVKHTYKTSGLYKVILKIKDETEQVDSDSLAIIVAGFNLDSNNHRHVPRVIVDTDYHSFSVGSISVVNQKANYKPGEIIQSYLKLTNYGDSPERLTIKVYLPEFGIIAISNAYIQSGNTVQIPLFIRLPNNVMAKTYTALITAENNRNEQKQNHWVFTVN